MTELLKTNGGSLSLWSWNKLKGEEACVHSDIYSQSRAHESRIVISNTSRVRSRTNENAPRVDVLPNDSISPVLSQYANYVWE